MDSRIEQLGHAAKSWYHINDYHRKYHNWYHAQTVTAATMTINGFYDPTLFLAAMWHDAVYFAGIGGDYNEKASAYALRQAGISYSDYYLKEVIRDAAVLIENTTISWHLSDCIVPESHGVLLDADLSAFALTFQEFSDNQDCIIRENDLVPNLENRHKCAEFLHQFLTVRKNIYHSTYGITTWEDIARDNITKYCSQHLDKSL